MFFSGFPKIIGMENFPSLQSLTLMGQQITMLENLECLPNLTELCVSESKLSVSQFLYDTVHCMCLPLFMGWVFSILVMCSWDSVILALRSRLHSCTMVNLLKAISQKIPFCLPSVTSLRLYHITVAYKPPHSSGVHPSVNKNQSYYNPPLSLVSNWIQFIMTFWILT